MTKPKVISEAIINVRELEDGSFNIGGGGNGAAAIEATYISKLRQIVKKLIKVKAAADGKIELISNQGQAMDGYSELYNYRSILETIEDK